MVKGVRKAIPQGQRAVGPFFLPARINQTMNPLQAIESLLQGQIIDPEKRGHYGRGELQALDARVLKRPAIVLLQHINLFPNHAAHAFGDLQGNLRELSPQRPMFYGRRNAAVLGEELHQTDGKERMTFGSALDERSQLGAESRSAANRAFR